MPFESEDKALRFPEVEAFVWFLDVSGYQSVVMQRKDYLPDLPSLNCRGLKEEEVAFDARGLVF